MISGSLTMLRTLAFPIERYPAADELLNLVRIEVAGCGQPLSIEMAIAAVFAGLTRADVRGLLSIGDEHEWATLALRALDRDPEGGQR